MPCFSVFCQIRLLCGSKCPNSRSASVRTFGDAFVINKLSKDYFENLNRKKTKSKFKL